MHVLALSARDDAALMELVQSLRSLLADGASVVDVCFTANTGRAQLGRRVSVRGASARRNGRRLSALLAGAPSSSSRRPRRCDQESTARGVLFTGQGSQYHGMARELYRTSPVFRKVIDRCVAALDGVLDLVSLLYGDGDASAYRRYRQRAACVVRRRNCIG